MKVETSTVPGGNEQQIFRMLVEDELYRQRRGLNGRCQMRRVTEITLTRRRRNVVMKQTVWRLLRLLVSYVSSGAFAWDVVFDRAGTTTELLFFVAVGQGYELQYLDFWFVLFCFNNVPLHSRLL